MTSLTTFKAWIASPQYAMPGDESDPEKLTFCNMDMTTLGWLEVGVAEIKIISTFDHNQLILSMANTLEDQISKERAKSHARVAVLEQRIKDLLLLTSEVPHG